MERKSKTIYPLSEMPKDLLMDLTNFIVSHIHEKEDEEGKREAYLINFVAVKSERGFVLTEYMTIEEASIYLGIDKSTLYRWRKEYKLPYKKIGGKIIYRKDDLDTFIEQHTNID